MEQLFKNARGERIAIYPLEWMLDQIAPPEVRKFLKEQLFGDNPELQKQGAVFIPEGAGIARFGCPFEPEGENIYIIFGPGRPIQTVQDVARRITLNRKNGLPFYAEMIAFAGDGRHAAPELYQN